VVQSLLNTSLSNTCDSFSLFFEKNKKIKSRFKQRLEHQFKPGVVTVSWESTGLYSCAMMHLTEQVSLKSLYDTGYLWNELRAYGCTSRSPASTSHLWRETKVVEENKAEAQKQAEVKDYQTSEWLCRLVLTRCAWPLGFTAACPSCPTLQPDHWVFELVNERT
jgi:hypothetical protein